MFIRENMNYILKYHVHCSFTHNKPSTYKLWNTLDILNVLWALCKISIFCIIWKRFKHEGFWCTMEYFEETLDWPRFQLHVVRYDYRPTLRIFWDKNHKNTVYRPVKSPGINTFHSYDSFQWKEDVRCYVYENNIGYRIIYQTKHRLFYVFSMDTVLNQRRSIRILNFETFY